MLGRSSFLGWKATLCALTVTASCGAVAAQNAPPPPAVSVTPVVSRQVTETGDYIGRVTAIDKVDVVARVPGFIEERTFTEGQQVKKGDLLFRIEQATYKAAVEQARATLAKAKATEVNAKLQLERGKELVRNNNIPQSTVDQRAADEAAAQASVMEAQAQLDQAEINLGYTEIRSPIDGRIGLATFTVGNLVQPSSGKLATIVSQDPIYVIFQVSQRNILEYRRRALTRVTIHIKLPDGSPYPHPGLSNFLDVQVDATTDTVAVRAQLPNPEGILTAGGVVSVPNMHVEFVHVEPPGIPTAFWRSVGPSHNVFVTESFMDELAAAAKQDPVVYRLALLDKTPRAKAVLALAAEKAGWGQPLPERVGRGVSLQFVFATYMAHVAEVEVAKDGAVRVRRVVCAVDCGTVVNPDTVRAQIQSAVIFGITAALHGKITLKDGRVEQTNFDSYQMLRMNEAPAIEVHIVQSSEPPGGMGEAGTSAIVPAVANAVFAATGKRLRKMPVDTTALKQPA